MDVESVSEELYGLPLDEFTPTRTDREKQAKSEGDKDLAAQIHRLAKPNMVAWLANQLAREHADEIRFLLQLGPALREATATGSGQQLRELSRQQSKVVYAVVQQARKLASAAGHKVSEDTARGLEGTLRAALADPDAADALAAGRLTEGMQNSGFGSPTSLAGRSSGSGKKSAAAASPVAADRTTGATSAAQQTADEKGTQALRKAAEHELEQAKSAAAEATTAREESLGQLETAARIVVEAGDRVERIRTELEEALEAQAKAQENQVGAQAALDRAEASLRDAQQRLADATNHLDGLAP